jgi:hypothetical protein
VTSKNKHIGVHRVPARTDTGRVSRLLLVAIMAAGVIASVWIVQSLRPPEPRTSIAADELGTFSPPLGKIGEAGECSDDDSAADEAEEQQQDEEQEQLQQREALDQQQLDESMQEAEEQNEEAQQQATQDQVQAQESDPQVIQDAQQG